MLKKIFKSLLGSENGATAIEYTLIAALISIVCIIAFRQLGSTMNDKLTAVSQAMESTTSGPTS